MLVSWWRFLAIVAFLILIWNIPERVYAQAVSSPLCSLSGSSTLDGGLRFLIAFCDSHYFTFTLFLLYVFVHAHF